MFRRLAIALALSTATLTTISVATPAAAAEIEVLKQVAPEYPRRARIANIEGHVDLKFVVSEDGRATDIEVVQAEPRRVFDYAAARALEGWRFNASDASKSGTVRIEFKI